MIGIGLLYRRGYFRQRLDITGRQQEYWLDADPKSLPMARVTAPDGDAAPARGRRSSAQPLAFQVWRVDVGRVPLLLLDAELPENDAVQRWTTGRLYEGNRAVRLAQYGLLGIGGARVLEALGIEPAVDPPERGPSGARAARARGRSDVERGCRVEEALERRARARRLHDAHAGRRRERDLRAGGVPRRLRRPRRRGSGSTTRRSSTSAACVPGDGGEPPGHDAARDPDEPPPQRRQPPARRGRARDVAAALPGHGARGADHARHERRAPADVRRRPDARACFDAPPRRRLARRVPPIPQSWEAVREIPNEELWAARCEARRRLVALRPRRRASRTACCAASRSTTCARSRRASTPTR